MKLRNKKTGEIVETDCAFGVSVPTDRFMGCKSYDQIAEYNSLAELNEEWEDYKPKEPLIKDKKIRKAVKAWAEANEIGSQDTIRFDAIEHRLIWVSTAIEFNEFNALSDLEKTDYTIAELCGEEEE